MQVRILKYFVSAPRPEHGMTSPNGFYAGETLSIPDPIGEEWEQQGLVERVPEIAMVAQAETAVRPQPKPRKRR